MDCILNSTLYMKVESYRFILVNTLHFYMESTPLQSNKSHWEWLCELSAALLPACVSLSGKASSEHEAKGTHTSAQTHLQMLMELRLSHNAVGFQESYQHPLFPSALLPSPPSFPHQSFFPSATTIPPLLVASASSWTWTVSSLFPYVEYHMWSVLIFTL